jgi:hypothetical protein
MVPTRRDWALMGQHCCHEAFLLHQGPERLSNRWDAPEGLCHNMILDISVPQEIVWP